LQGSGCQLLAVFQNIQQFRFTYGPHSPLLASVSTSVYYTPTDQETADVLSEALGVTTERLHPESQTRTFWGMLTSTTVGTSEHARLLLTSDEVSRLPESAAIILSKGLAPVLGEKLGAPTPEIIDLSPPRLKRIAAIIGAVLMAGSLSAWALWPTSRPAPILSLTPLVVDPQALTGSPEPETRRVNITLDYYHRPTHLRFAERPERITGELVGMPDAFEGVELRYPINLASTRAGTNTLLLSKYVLSLPNGLRFPTRLATSPDPAFQPVVLSLQAEPIPDPGPPAWTLIENIAPYRILGRFPTSLACGHAMLQAAQARPMPATTPAPSCHQHVPRADGEAEASPPTPVGMSAEERAEHQRQRQSWGTRRPIK